MFHNSFFIHVGFFSRICIENKAVLKIVSNVLKKIAVIVARRMYIPMKIKAETYDCAINMSMSPGTRKRRAITVKTVVFNIVIPNHFTMLSPQVFFIVIAEDLIASMGPRFFMTIEGTTKVVTIAHAKPIMLIIN